jgi:hypothetical protein
VGAAIPQTCVGAGDAGNDATEARWPVGDRGNVSTRREKKGAGPEVPALPAALEAALAEEHGAEAEGDEADDGGLGDGGGDEFAGRQHQTAPGADEGGAGVGIEIHERGLVGGQAEFVEAEKELVRTAADRRRAGPIPNGERAGPGCEAAVGEAEDGGAGGEIDDRVAK